jgi:hypothetical protein
MSIAHARPRIQAVVAALGITVTMTASIAGSLPAGAGAVTYKTVQIGNKTAVTLQPGWTASRAKSNAIYLAHKSPKAEIVILALGPSSVTVESAATTTFNNFAAGFGLKHVKLGPSSVSTIPSTLRFDQIDSFSYTAKLGKQSLGGLVAMFQSSTTHDGAFAVAIGSPKDESKLKNGVQQIFASLAANPN